jgi:hypothetical protein
MRTRPSAVAFNVMGTLFPLDPLREPFVGLGRRPRPWKSGTPGPCATNSDTIDGSSPLAAPASCGFPEEFTGTTSSADGII